MYKNINPEESFIYTYIEKCFDSQNVNNITKIMLIIIDAKHEKEDLLKNVNIRQIGNRNIICLMVR